MARKDEMGVQLRSHTQDEDLVRLYLDNIGKYPLLTQDEECRLSKTIQEGQEAKDELERGKVTTARRPLLLAAAQRGDAASEQFISANLRLVVSIAKRYQSTDLPLFDLVQEGNLGLDARRDQVRLAAGLQVLDVCHVVDQTGHKPWHRQHVPHDPAPGPCWRPGPPPAYGPNISSRGKRAARPAPSELAEALGINERQVVSSSGKDRDRKPRRAGWARMAKAS